MGSGYGFGLNRNRKVTGNVGAFKTLKVGNQSVIAGTGYTFYVDSGASNASNNNDGRNWANPLATVDAAIGKCTANRGDVILVAEGHAETWTTTGAKLIADVAGITIIGLGVGASRPTFTFGHTGTTWTISAASVTLCNLLLVTNVDLVTTYGTISGNDCTLIDVETRDTTDKEVVDDFTVTGDRLTVVNFFKNGYVGGDANARVFKMTGVDNALFEDCRFLTKVTTGVINFAGTSCTNVVAKECVFYVNSTTDGSKNIVDTIGSSTYMYLSCGDLSAGLISTGNISTVTDALYGTTGIASFPAGAAAANNVSIAEVLRYVQENICRGGTILPATQSLYDILAGANGIATFPASAAPANDVSLAEVIRDIWDVLRNGTGGAEPATNKSIVDYIKANSDNYNAVNYLALAVDFTSATWNTQAAHEIFTVTGLVRMKVIAEVVTTLTDAGNGGTVALGVEGDATSWIAASDSDNMTTGTVWADNTPGDTHGNYSSLVLDKVVNGVDVGYTIGGEAITGGSMIFHCWWEAKNATGAVAAGAGGVL